MTDMVVLIIVAVLYTGLFYRLCFGTIKRLCNQYALRVLKSKEVYQKNLLQEDQIYQEKRQLEEQVDQIHTLYDITREITRSVKELDAFRIFKQKLAGHIDFTECIFGEPLSEEAKTMKKDSDFLVIPLKGQRLVMGYLGLKGVAPEDQDTVMILVNQFALGLRRIKLYSEVERLAITDGLTGVFTRRYILERFDEELKRAKVKKLPLAFLMFDVDYFKKVNDEFGHLAGDQVLKSVARIVQESIREIDIMGRYGGEEFCLVLPDTGKEDALYVAERIRSAVESAEIRAYDTHIRSTISVGISHYPEDGKKSSSLIDKADWALYRAKKLGRNRVCVFGVYED